MTVSYGKEAGREKRIAAGGGAGITCRPGRGGGRWLPGPERAGPKRGGGGGGRGAGGGGAQRGGGGAAANTPPAGLGRSAPDPGAGEPPGIARRERPAGPGRCRQAVAP